MARGLLGHPEDDPTNDIRDEADSVTLMPADEAHAVARPSSIGSAYHEDEYDDKARLQRPRWRAEGARAARPHQVKAGGLEHRVELVQDMLESAKSQRDEVRAALKATTAALAGYTRREPHAKFWYVLRWSLLLGGDIAGVSGAAIFFGEIPALAVMQAIAAAIAAVTAGLVGQDIRDARLARRRQRDVRTLPANLQPYAHLFSGGDVGEKIARAMVYAGLAVALLVFGGIFALRTGAEDGLAGAVYGCLAGAICLASAINCYFYADEIADLLEHAQLRYDRAVKHLDKLSRSPELVAYGEAAAAAAALQAEYELEGEAAELGMRALKHGISRRHPGILGHGRPPAPPAKPVTVLPEFEVPELSAQHTNGDGQ